jgi:hypothetical protein
MFSRAHAPPLRSQEELIGNPYPSREVVVVGSRNALGYLERIHIQWFAGSSWFVDPLATGLNNGTSWTNAWTSLPSIVWGTSGVKAGDLLSLSGGAVSQTYTATGLTMLAVGASGTAGSPITISVGVDSGHNGQVIFDLAATARYAISMGGHSYINITGVAGDATSGVTAYGWKVINPLYYAYAGVVYYAGGETNWLISHIEFDMSGLSGAGDDFYSAIHIGGSGRTGFEISYNWVHGTSGAHAHCTGMILIRTDASTSYTDYLIHHNAIQYLYHDGIDFNNATYYDNVFQGISGSGHGDATNIQINGYCKVYANTYTDWGEQAIYLDAIGANNIVNVFIYNNLFSSAAGGLCIVLQPESAGTGTIDSIYIINNTCIGTSGNFLRSTYARVTNVHQWNNVIGPTGTAGFYPIEVLAPTADFTSTADLDYNVYDPAGHYGTTTALFAGITKTFTQVQALGYETHGNFATVLVDPTSGTLEVGSPAIGTGVDLSVYFTVDKNGVTRTAPWDMGAFAYGSAPPASPKYIIVKK